MSVEITGATSIPEYAFNNCSQLSSIRANKSVKSIGTYAFSKCAGISEFEIPEEVTSIGSRAFSQCSSLQGIKIPEGITSLSTSVFSSCTALKTAELSEGLTIIGDSAFYNCSQLEEPELPTTLKSINQGAFQNCTNLKGISFPEGLTTIGQNAFYGCSGITELEVPDSVTTIGRGAFRGTQLLTAKLPFTGTSRTATGSQGVLGYIFDYTSSNETGTVQQNYGSGSYSYYFIPSTLSDVEITDATSVPGYAFNNCKNLSHIQINDVLSIGSHAFSGCSRISEFDIPKSLLSCGTDAFNGCSSLKTVNIHDLNAWIAIDFGNGTTSKPTNYGADLLLNGEVVNITSIPNNATKIGDYAFYGREDLTEVVIPDTVRTIGKHAFDNCNRVVTVSNMAAVYMVGGYAFYKCDALEKVKYHGSEDEWSKISFGAFNESLLNANREYIVNIHITLKANNNEYGRFSYCINEGESIEIDSPNEIMAGNADTITVSAIPREGYFFWKWDNNETGTTMTISNTAEAQLTALFEAIPATPTENVLKLPEALRVVADNAFSGNVAQCIIIGKNAAWIGDDAFQNCINLNQIHILSNDVEVTDKAFSGLDTDNLYFFVPAGT